MSPKERVNCRCSLLFSIDASQAVSTEFVKDITGEDVLPTDLVSDYVYFKTIKEAEKWALENAALKVNFSGLDLDVANEVNKALHDMIVINNYKKLDSIEAVFEEKFNAFAWVDHNSIYLNKQMHKKEYFEGLPDWTPEHELLKDDIKKINERIEKRKKIFIDNGEDWTDDSRIEKMEYRISEKEKALKEVPNVSFSFDGGKGPVGNIVTHEYGHIADNNYLSQLAEGLNQDEVMDIFRDRLSTLGSQENLRYSLKNISQYSSTNENETVAESWSVYHSKDKDKLSPLMKDHIEKLIEAEKK